MNSGNEDPGPPSIKKPKVDDENSPKSVQNGDEEGSGRGVVEVEEDEDQDFVVSDDDDESEDGNDDETTLNEDEDSEETNENEILELQEEGDLPLEQLLERYGCAPGSGSSPPSTSTAGTSAEFSSHRGRHERRKKAEQCAARSSLQQQSSFEVLPNLEASNSGTDESGVGSSSQDDSGTEEGIPERNLEFQYKEEDSPRRGSPNSSVTPPGEEQNECEDEEGFSYEHSSLSYMIAGSEDDENSDEDVDYVPPEIWKKEPRIGPDFQVEVGNLAQGDTQDEAETGEDRLIWAPPDQMSERKVEEYLRNIYEILKEREAEKKANQNKDSAERGDADQEMNGPFNGGECPDLNESGENEVVSRLRDDEDALLILLESRYKEGPALDKQRKLAFSVPGKKFDCRFLLSSNPDRRLRALERLAEMQNNDSDQSGSANHDQSGSANHEGQSKESGSKEGGESDADWLECRSWSDDQSELFEEGLRLYGKNFGIIRETMLPNREIGELIRYYYSWKKTERHDMFVQRVRFEKRQYTLNPNTTDFMDHFLSQIDGGQPGGPAAVTVHHPYLDVPHMDAGLGENGGVGTASQASNAPGASPQYLSSSLISSDPKHALGQFHATHFNEWQGQGMGMATPASSAAAHEPPTTLASPRKSAGCDAATSTSTSNEALPQLDTEIVDEILKT